MPESEETQQRLHEFIMKLEAQRDAGEISSEVMRGKLNEVLVALANGDPAYHTLIRASEGA